MSSSLDQQSYLDQQNDFEQEQIDSSYQSKKQKQLTQNLKSKIYSQQISKYQQKHKKQEHIVKNIHQNQNQNQQSIQFKKIEIKNKPTVSRSLHQIKGIINHQISSNKIHFNEKTSSKRYLLNDKRSNNKFLQFDRLSITNKGIVHKKLRQISLQLNNDNNKKFFRNIVNAVQKIENIQNKQHSTKSKNNIKQFLTRHISPSNKHPQNSIYNQPQRNSNRKVVYIKTFLLSSFQSISIQISYLFNSIIIIGKMIGQQKQILKLILDQNKSDKLIKQCNFDWEILANRLYVVETDYGKKIKIASIILKKQNQKISEKNYNNDGPDSENVIHNHSSRINKIKKNRLLRQREFIQRNYYSQLASKKAQYQQVKTNQNNETIVQNDKVIIKNKQNNIQTRQFRTKTTLNDNIVSSIEDNQSVKNNLTSGVNSNWVQRLSSGHRNYIAVQNKDNEQTKRQQVQKKQVVIQQKMKLQKKKQQKQEKRRILIERLSKPKQDYSKQKNYSMPKISQNKNKIVRKIQKTKHQQQNRNKINIQNNQNNKRPENFLNNNKKIQPEKQQNFKRLTNNNNRSITSIKNDVNKQLLVNNNNKKVQPSISPSPKMQNKFSFNQTINKIKSIKNLHTQKSMIMQTTNQKKKTQSSDNQQYYLDSFEKQAQIFGLFSNKNNNYNNMNMNNKFKKNINIESNNQNTNDVKFLEINKIQTKKKQNLQENQKYVTDFNQFQEENIKKKGQKSLIKSKSNYEEDFQNQQAYDDQIYDDENEDDEQFLNEGFKRKDASNEKFAKINLTKKKQKTEQFNQDYQNQIFQ